MYGHDQLIFLYIHTVLSRLNVNVDITVIWISVKFDKIQHKISQSQNSNF